MAEQQADIRVQVTPFQVIIQMKPYDWDIALGVYQDVMGDAEYKNFARMLQQKLQRTAQV